MADLVGQQLGHYRLLRVLGRGAFAEVYLGEHLYLERLAAIKVLHVQMDPQAQEQFRREARTIAHLQHPNIVRVLDFGLQDQTPFLVLEYIPNGTLRTRHPTGTRLPLEQIVTYVKQIASALDYAHQQHVIHCDVKPENMLLNANDEVVLSDFGIAMVQQTRESLLTQDLAGTPLYMAPEQIQGKPCPASDQYSLAVVVYEWLCGEPPFRGSLFEVYSQHLYRRPPGLRTPVPHLPHPVENVVLVALAKDPHQRYTSVQDFATVLSAASFATQPPVSPLLTEREARHQHAPPIPLSAPMATPPARAEDLSGEPMQPRLMPSQQTGDEQELGQQVTPLSVVPSPTVSKQARWAGTQTNRERLLRKVRAFWIAGVLEHSLHGAALIALGLDQPPDAVAHPWQLMLHHPAGAPHALPAGTRITQVYDAAEGELLILGAPGSGKTTLLLELARELLTRAEHDKHHSLPVVFNLSSWALKQQSLVDWLVEELNRTYQVPRKLGQAWVDADQILPLLDGLDELSPKDRTRCIETINAYRQEHGFLPLVVCSRSADYLAQTGRLQLGSAVMVQPLTQQQVDDYLASGGEPLSALREALHRDAALRELTSTPLMLSLLTLSYQGMPVEDLLREASLTDRQRQIFEYYVERMLRYRGAAMHYPQKQTTHWLSWVARQMKQQSQTVFFLEQMQPSWLTSRQRQLYEWLAIRFPACLTGVLISLATCLAFFETNSYDLIRNSLVLIGNGLLGAGLAGLLSSSRMILSSRDGERGSARKHGYQVIGMFGIGVLAGLLFVLGNSYDRRSGLSLSIERDFLLKNGVSLGLICALIYGLCSIGLALAVSHSHRADPLRSLHTSLSPGRAWRRCWQHLTRHAPLRNGFLTGLIYGLSSGLSSGLMSSQLSSGLGYGLSSGLRYGLIWGLIGGLLSVLLAGQTTMIRLLDRIQWSWKRFGHNLLSKHLRVILFGLSIGLIWLIRWLITGLGYGLSPGLSSWLSYGLSTGLSTAIFIGLIYWMLISPFQAVVSETMDEQHRVRPGQGIRRSAHNGLILGLTSSVVCVLIYMVSSVISWESINVAIHLFHVHQGNVDFRTALYLSLPYGLVFGLACGLLVALLKGGLAWFQHATLRLLLWCVGSVPWRYVQFLDYAADHILLCKVGGGYIFIHRLLLEYFALLDTTSKSDASERKSNWQSQPHNGYKQI